MKKSSKQDDEPECRKPLAHSHQAVEDGLPKMDLDEAELHYDHMTQIIGEVGPWQIFWLFILCVPIAFHAWQMLANKWLTYPTDHWCARPESMSEMSAEEWRNLSAPLTADGSFDKCHVFLVDYSSVTERPPEDTMTVPCNRWEYDHSLFKNTAIERWDLVCNRKWIPRTIQMLFFVGNFIGVLGAGHLSDKFGRKFVYMGFLTTWICFGVAGGVVDNLVAWAICRFMCGACSLAYNTVFAVFAVELTHGKWRAILGHLFGELVWNLGIMTLGGLVYGVRHMQHLEIIIGLSAVPWLPLWCFMFESPRWLLSKGRKTQAERVLVKACKMNKREPSNVSAFVEAFKHEEKKTNSFTDLLRTPGMRRNTLSMCYCWLSFSMGYFGLLYNTPTMSWNPFLVFVFPSFIVSLIAIVQPFFENKLGRKTMLTGSLLIASIALLITTGLQNNSAGIISCAWLGTIACSVAFGVGYNFTKELYPTSTRTSALSLASASARIGSIISPFIGMLDSISPVVPLVTYGAIVLGSGLTSIWIWPETNNIRLPETLDECERLAQTPNAWLSCCKKNESRRNDDS